MGLSHIEKVVVAATVLAAIILYTAWINSTFRRCPHCRKIGSWRYDPLEPAAVEKDEDGAIVSSRRACVCRKCKQKVLDKWSDSDGRTLEKL